MDIQDGKQSGSAEQDSTGKGFEFVGDGEMVERVNRLDWAATPAGASDTWPEGIRTAVSIALNSTFQLVVLAGRDMVYVYNDASRSIFGAKHPWALGRPAEEVWDEIWPTIGPMLHSVFETGHALRYDDMLMVLKRHGFDEEAYFTFSYSPIREANGEISGLFLSVLETSERVINERRMRMLTDLAARVAAGRGESAYAAIGEVLAANPVDVPFYALYLCDREGKTARRVFMGPDALDGPAPAAEVALARNSSHPVAQAVAGGKHLVFDRAELDSGAEGSFDGQTLRCMALPLMLPGTRKPCGALLLGVNPRQSLDAAHHGFFELVAGHVATAVANAEAARVEQERLAALAELDRSKSAFLANASHELRTPLTLIEGPLGTLLDDPAERLSGAARESLEMARRNTSRMKVLVNSLLDFAKIEAGRMAPQLEPVDLGVLTAELASLFRSGFAAAGIDYEVDVRPGEIHTLVDHEMWEKIVLNLLSNALKYTPAGQVRLALGRHDGELELSVSDTGIGIAREDLPHVTERFYRGRRRAARSPSESTGLGLALVSELARLLGGTLEIDSAVGRGTRVTVRLPDRAAPRLAGTEGDRASAGMSELTRAVFAGVLDPGPAAPRPPATQSSAIAPAPQAGADRLKVVVIDDNEDILRYVERLLQDVCTVVTVGEATRALDVIRSIRPDVVLLDVMMPEVDGFELLGRIRSDPSVQSVSVIVLSAHVAENARLEAMAAGADDYLPKPFSGRELIATVRSHFNLARIRRAAVEREGMLMTEIADIRGNMESLIEGTSDAFVHIGRDLRIRALNDVSVQLSGKTREQMIGRRFDEVRPDAAPTLAAMREAMERQCIVGTEYFHKRSRRWFNVRCYPTRDGAIALGNDITARKHEETNLRLAHEQLESRVRERTSDLNAANELLKALFDRAPAPIAMTRLDGRIMRANLAFEQLVGYDASELCMQSMESLTDPEDFMLKRRQIERLLAGEIATFEMEMRYRRKDGQTIWVENFVGTIPGDDGRPRYFVKIVQDVTDRKRSEELIKASQAELRALYDRLQRVRKEERIALAREVHDHLGQLLSAAKIDIKLLLEDVQGGAAQVSRRKLVPELRSASQSLEAAIGSVRSIARELRPPEIESQGLYAAIRWHAQDFERRTRIRFELELPPGGGPTGLAAGELFRIFQEALTNVLRHAMATQVTATVQVRGDRLLLRVRDNGVGIARRAAAGPTLGLVGMRERAELSGGRVVVLPLRSGGTLVSALVPIGDAHTVHGR
ncbi:MAG TPA: ATP-binding protein [Telluria sp.]|nr:ATP-binding protein [Telluria sp.]